jgi:hypothetical protein
MSRTGEREEKRGREQKGRWRRREKFNGNRITS